MDPMHFVLSDVKLLAVNEISNWLKLIEAHWCKRHVACNMASKSSFSLADTVERPPCVCKVMDLFPVWDSEFSLSHACEQFTFYKNGLVT